MKTCTVEVGSKDVKQPYVVFRGIPKIPRYSDATIQNTAESGVLVAGTKTLGLVQ